VVIGQLAKQMLGKLTSETRSKRRFRMNPEILKGRWNQLRGEIRTRWGKLTDDDVTQIQGQAEKMIGKLQERYGYKREQAEKELNEFLTAPPTSRRTA
jgi:uncharacterized protein YjbJ (UPF0337 family)